MFEIGLGECGVIVLVALLVFGPEKLEQMSQTVGQLIGRWQRALNLSEISESTQTHNRLSCDRSLDKKE